jgi:hypothetical protein
MLLNAFTAQPGFSPAGAVFIPDKFIDCASAARKIRDLPGRFKRYQAVKEKKKRAAGAGCIADDDYHSVKKS